MFILTNDLHDVAYQHRVLILTKCSPTTNNQYFRNAYKRGSH